MIADIKRRLSYTLFAAMIFTWLAILIIYELLRPALV